MFKRTKPSRSPRVNDTWTRKAREMGYPSRAVFKLMQANKKHRIIRKNDVVLDLGCSPGSWTKLSAHLAGGDGFVLAMDITELTHQQQMAMGVRPHDIDQEFDAPVSYSPRYRDHDELQHESDEKSALLDGLLPSERRLIMSRAPVGYLHQDATVWQPGRGFLHNVDVVLSDMAPRTTGIASNDSDNSIELCYSVIDLCSKIYKPPMTTSRLLNDYEMKQRLNDLGEHGTTAALDNLTSDMQRRMDKKYGDKQPNNDTIDLKLLKKTLTTYVQRRKDQNTTIEATTTGMPAPSDSIVSGHDMNPDPTILIPTQPINNTHSPVYRINDTTFVQLQGNEEITTSWRGTLLMKVFQGPGYNDMMQILKQLFVSTHTFKPDASRSESVEIFVVAKGYCGPFDHIRIQHKHLRRPKTHEYLRQYKANNKKRIPAPLDPTRHVKFATDEELKKLISPSSPHNSIYDEPADNEVLPDHVDGYTPIPLKQSSRRSLQDLYAQYGDDAMYTSDAALNDTVSQRHEEYKQEAWNVISQGITTNVHSAIESAAMKEQGEMTPLQREISESDDLVSYRQEQFDQLWDSQQVTNRIPTPEELTKSMSLYWDEGINFAKRIQSQTNVAVRYDVHQGRQHDVHDEIAMDPVDALIASEPRPLHPNEHSFSSSSSSSSPVSWRDLVSNHQKRVAALASDQNIENTHHTTTTTHDSTDILRDPSLVHRRHREYNDSTDEDSAASNNDDGNHTDYNNITNPSSDYDNDTTIITNKRHNNTISDTDYDEAQLEADIAREEAERMNKKCNRSETDYDEAQLEADIAREEAEKQREEAELLAQLEAETLLHRKIQQRIVGDDEYPDDGDDDDDDDYDDVTLDTYRSSQYTSTQNTKTRLTKSDHDDDDDDDSTNETYGIRINHYHNSPTDNDHDNISSPEDQLTDNNTITTIRPQQDQKDNDNNESHHKKAKKRKPSYDIDSDGDDPTRVTINDSHQRTSRYSSYFTSDDDDDDDDNNNTKSHHTSLDNDDGDDDVMPYRPSRRSHDVSHNDDDDDQYNGNVKDNTDNNNGNAHGDNAMLHSQSQHHSSDHDDDSSDDDIKPYRASRRSRSHDISDDDYDDVNYTSPSRSSLSQSTIKHSTYTPQSMTLNEISSDLIDSHSSEYALDHDPSSHNHLDTIVSKTTRQNMTGDRSLKTDLPSFKLGQQSSNSNWSDLVSPAHQNGKPWM